MNMNDRLHGLSAVGWFTACGLPLEASDLSEARAYLAALQMHSSVRIEVAASWTHAERIIRSPVWDMSWWEREESERRRLTALCVQRLGDAAVHEALDLAIGQEHEILHGAATLAAARLGVADEALVRAAAGAAGMAAHGRALALLAQAGDDHIFMRKYALFAGGRWPLGLVGGAFHIF